ncbi:DUF2878 domain-containing protein [Desulfopila sp. IMCC35006]|uniref:DUF2878 domain-containing protein n=1 Tax=Desulfopila sp. IMCC35006 TaxID=2569542 RepID=UPI001F115BA3|nr:DUF2878 domain-containing protein [Desulfopila sp. IMCC35006]
MLLYQLIWFLCVLGGNRGALAALPLLLMHLALTGSRAADLKMMGIMAFLGLAVDGTLQHIGFFKFTTAGFPIPLWLMVIWLGLAITPHHSLAWLQSRPVLSAVFGALGGPAAYWAGVRLGAASFQWPLLQALAFLSLLWACLWSLVMYCSMHAKVDESGKKR